MDCKGRVWYITSGAEWTSSKIASPGKEPGPSHPVYCKPADRTALPGCEVRTLYRHVGADNGRLGGACGHYYYLNSVSKYPYVTTTLSAHSCNSWDAGGVVIEDPHNQWFLKNLVFLSLSLRSIRTSNQGQHDSPTGPGSQASTPYRYDQKVIRVISASTSLASICHMVTPSWGKPGKCSLWLGCQLLSCRGENGYYRTAYSFHSTSLFTNLPNFGIGIFSENSIYLRRCGHNTPIIFLFLGRWKLWNCFNYFNVSKALV